MNKILTLALATTILSVPALAADEFGSRFGENSPYALDNTVGDAVADTDGIDMNDINDLNAIAPAAGDETEVEAIVETEGEVTAEDGEVEVDAETEVDADHSYDHTDKEHDSETEVEADTEIESGAE